MKLVSLSVGLPRVAMWRGERVTTGIFKEPVVGPVMLRTLNLDGDRQADLSVHGGPAKAVYVYPAEHYAYWRAELPATQWQHGAFGENFTTEGLVEGDINIGDRFRLGEAELEVTEPRLPCFKLAVKFGRADMVKRFLASRRTGFYFRVLREGAVEAGDSIVRVSRDEHRVSVADIVRLYAFDPNDLESLRRVVRVEALPHRWRDHFRVQIAKLEGRSVPGK